LAVRSRLQWKSVSELETYIPKLRRNVGPYWFEIGTDEDRRKAEYTLIDAGQKDPSDLLARYVHSPIENWVVARLSRVPVTPNQVTFAVNVLAYTVTALLATGYLLPGSILTFVVGLMDGFDGKLARVKGMTTRVGAMEHAFDLLFEFSWILALAYHLSLTQGSAPLIIGAFTIVLIAFYRNVYDRFGQSVGSSLDVYGSFERAFRRVAGRRNLFNIQILVFVLLGIPFYALVGIFVHALVTALVYAVAALVHLDRIDRGANVP
jgi:phosphatidylglycerophosphate synthase